MATFQKITPFLWFNDQAEQAASFYVTLFPDSKIVTLSRYPEGAPLPKGTVMVAEVQLAGMKVLLLNGGPHFKLSEAFSFMVTADDQAEVDRLWEAITSNGGQESQCGWCKDRFGLSWQVVPRRFNELMSSKEPGVAGRVMGAMMKMRKFDVAKLEEAANG